MIGAPLQGTMTATGSSYPMLAGGDTTRPVSWHHVNAPSSPHASGGQARMSQEPLGCCPLTAHQPRQSKAPKSRDTPDEPLGAA
jgi:hypothetical protein